MKELEQVLAGHDIDTASLEPWMDGYRLTIPCGRGIPTWLRLRSLVSMTGHWPILSETGDLEEIAHGKTYDQRTVEQIIEASRSIDPAERLEAWRRNHLEGLEEGRESERAASAGSGGVAGEFLSWFDGMIANDGFPRGPWPEEPGSTELETTLERPWRKLAEVAVVLVPTIESRDVPAHLYFGNWNECPRPEDHVALFDYWHRRYEAEVMTVTHDVIEMRVGRPPRTPEEAIALAKEQYLYCSDIVDQGTETIDRLAAGLLESPVWFFWWD